MTWRDMKKLNRLNEKKMMKNLEEQEYQRMMNEPIRSLDQALELMKRKKEHKIIEYCWVCLKLMFMLFIIGITLFIFFWLVS